MKKFRKTENKLNVPLHCYLQRILLIWFYNIAPIRLCRLAEAPKTEYSIAMRFERMVLSEQNFRVKSDANSEKNYFVTSYLHHLKYKSHFENSILLVPNPNDTEEFFFHSPIFSKIKKFTKKEKSSYYGVTK